MVQKAFAGGPVAQFRLSKTQVTSNLDRKPTSDSATRASLLGNVVIFDQEVQPKIGILEIPSDCKVKSVNYSKICILGRTDWESATTTTPLWIPPAPEIENSYPGTKPDRHQQPADRKEPLDSW